jgi:hypothetical protein
LIKNFYRQDAKSARKNDFYRNPSSSIDVMPAEAGIQLHINIALISGFRLSPE